MDNKIKKLIVIGCPLCPSRFVLDSDQLEMAKGCPYCTAYDNINILVENVPANNTHVDNCRANNNLVDNSRSNNNLVENFQSGNIPIENSQSNNIPVESFQTNNSKCYSNT
jgi:hypothetical protein